MQVKPSTAWHWAYNGITKGFLIQSTLENSSFLKQEIDCIKILPKHFVSQSLFRSNNSTKSKEKIN